MSLPSFSVKKRVTVSMIFLGVAVLGMVAFMKLPLDMLPDIEPPIITIMTPWIGASATDIEQKVTNELENALSMVSDLEEISSISMDAFLKASSLR